MQAWVTASISKQCGCRCATRAAFPMRLLSLNALSLSLSLPLFSPAGLCSRRHARVPQTNGGGDGDGGSGRSVERATDARHTTHPRAPDPICPASLFGYSVTAVRAQCMQTKPHKDLVHPCFAPSCHFSVDSLCTKGSRREFARFAAWLPKPYIYAKGGGGR